MHQGRGDRTRRAAVFSIVLASAFFIYLLLGLANGKGYLGGPEGIGSTLAERSEARADSTTAASSTQGLRVNLTERNPPAFLTSITMTRQEMDLLGDQGIFLMRLAFADAAEADRMYNEMRERAGLTQDFRLQRRAPIDWNSPLLAHSWEEQTYGTDEDETIEVVNSIDDILETLETHAGLNVPDDKWTYVVQRQTLPYSIPGRSGQFAATGAWYETYVNTGFSGVIVMNYARSPKWSAALQRADPASQFYRHPPLPAEDLPPLRQWSDLTWWIWSHANWPQGLNSYTEPALRTRNKLTYIIIPEITTSLVPLQVITSCVTNHRPPRVQFHGRLEDFKTAYRAFTWKAGDECFNRLLGTDLGRAVAWFVIGHKPYMNDRIFYGVTVARGASGGTTVEGASSASLVWTLGYKGDRSLERFDYHVARACEERVYKDAEEAQGEFPPV